MSRVQIGNNVVEFPDSLTPDQLQSAAASAAQQLGDAGNPSDSHPVVTAIKDIISNYKNSQTGSPQDVLERIDQAVTNGFGKAGEFGAEQLGKEGVDPRVAAGVGTAIQMAPEVAKLATPEEPTTPEISDTTTSFARRALGFTKRQLNTPLAREQADEAAQVALEEGVIPWTGSRDAMQANALALKDRTGQAIGKIRDSVGPVELQPFVKSLEDLKANVLKGRTGGVWDDMAAKIDKAIDTVKGLGANGKATLQDVADAKKAYGDTVNWLSDRASQKVTKRITGTLADSIDKSVADSGADTTAYRDANKRYGASKKMLEGIDNAISSDEGNNIFGPTASFTAAAQAATGNIPGAATSLGLVQALKRYGNSPMARLLYLADRFPSMPTPPTPFLQLIAGQMAKKTR